MQTFDDLVLSLLQEDATKYDFDVKKSFFIIPGSETEFIKRLHELAATSAPVLQPSGLPPSRRPMYQIGDVAGTVADSQLWASAILDYYENHSDDTNLNMEFILRNCRVKPTDLALHNFYTDIKDYFGDITEYRLPEEEHGIERAQTIQKTSQNTNLMGNVLKAMFSSPKKKK